jgi:hypothetical protein
MYNQDRYPLRDKAYLDTEEVKGFQDEFNRRGILVLYDFIPPSLQDKMLCEALSLSHSGFQNEDSGNVYLSTDIDPSLPDDHPQRMMLPSKVSVVGDHLIPEGDIAKQVFLDNDVLNFIERVAQLGKVYRYACELGALNYTYMKAGEPLRWHFDQSEFVVSIPIQNPVSGGEFEYAFNIRSKDNPNYEEIRKIIKGDRSRVQATLPPPGSLILFRGKNTMHGVSQVHGDVLRINALLGYALEPNVVSSPYLRRIRYGK